VVQTSIAKKGALGRSREGRRHVRYKIKSGTLAALPLPGTLKVIVGQIIDMSEGGLALKHKDEITKPLNNVEIILMGHEQSGGPAFELPARFVYELEQGEDYRSGFQFGDLSKGQISRLDSFIQSNIDSVAF
jgi:c-di-GMP-binding flagellar brake protein YcgR